MTMECYVPNKTTDVPLSVTNNCILMHFTEENCLMLKNDEKAGCRALHAFLGLFWVYVRLYLRNERSLQSESYICFELHTVSHIWA